MNRLLALSLVLVFAVPLGTGAADTVKMSDSTKKATAKALDWLAQGHRYDVIFCDSRDRDARENLFCCRLRRRCVRN